jgi:predicted Zn-dependent protease
MLLAIMAGVPLLLGIDGCGASPLGIDEQTEIQIGQQAAADIEQQYGVITGTAQAQRVNRIGQAIAARSERPGLPWSFRILNVSDVNAVSLPGGPIYVTRGLLEAGVSDAELAGVLAHEVAHVNQRHSVAAIRRAMTYDLLSDLVFGRSSAALQTAVNVAVQYAVQLPRSREAEYESDSIGIRLAYNAGYPAGGLVTFFQRLQQISGPQTAPSWMRTHPTTADRIARAQQIVAQVQGQPRPVPVALLQREVKEIKAVATEKSYEPQVRLLPE